ncbi:MAG: hypothetical protein Q8O72_07950 [Bacteroidales bacterium]|nr:hypothetical protein [Bacteroidales bacterium]
MNKDEFIGFMQTPSKLNAQTIYGLASLVGEFPYCSSVHILLSVNQYKEKDVRYETELRTTAIYSGDRSILKKHIDRAGEWNVRIVLPDEEKTPEVKAPGVAPKMDEPVRGETAQPLEAGVPEIETSSSLKQDSPGDDQADIGLEIQELKEIVNRHIDELEHESQLKHDLEKIPETVETPKVEREKTKEELLDEFIKNQPSITRPRASFFNPLDVAKESIVDQENIISETLATIYYDQGHLQKAIKIYQKLSLKYPEKSTYFAALIQKAEKELNT